jgi:hypothetical protein
MSNDHLHPIFKQALAPFMPKQPADIQVLTGAFKQTGHQPCELWKHKVTNVTYAIPLKHCPPVNCEFLQHSTVTI